MVVAQHVARRPPAPAYGCTPSVAMMRRKPAGPAGRRSSRNRGSSAPRSEHERALAAVDLEAVVVLAAGRHARGLERAEGAAGELGQEQRGVVDRDLFGAFAGGGGEAAGRPSAGRSVMNVFFMPTTSPMSPTR